MNPLNQYAQFVMPTEAKDESITTRFTCSLTESHGLAPAEEYPAVETSQASTATPPDTMRRRST